MMTLAWAWVITSFMFSFFGFVPALTTNDKERLLLISFDGFRWNYLQRTDTPNFDRITKNGVHAVHGLTNAFVTKTFPNHMTLVTGQWEETHGIVANTMYDPLLNRSFKPHDEKANTEAAWFDQGGEPIWVTNQLQKKDGKSGVIMWVGGGAPFKNVTPTEFKKFDSEVKNKTKVDLMIKWFKEGCNLGLIYFDQPDRFGHAFGPESEQVTRMIGGLDKLIGYLLDGLEKEEMLHTTNMIITSDHGFTSTPVDKSIDLCATIDCTTLNFTSSTPIAGIWPHPGFKEEIYNNLTKAAEKESHFTVYLKENVPEHFHYTHNRRIPPILVVAEDHYSFTEGQTWHLAGNHGYDNRLQDMHPFFVAMGPAFKSGFSVDTFKSVDVYPLMCRILSLEPAPNNGSMEIVKALLKTTVKRSAVLHFLKKNHFGSILVAGIVCTAVLAAGCIVFLEVRKKRKQEANSRVIMDDVWITTEEPTGNLRTDSDTSKVPLLQDHEF